MDSRAIPIPLAPDHWATLIVRTPMPPAEWTQLLAVLDAMRPALVDDGIADGGQEGRDASE